jgi:hypothetical protein
MTVSFAKLDLESDRAQFSAINIASLKLPFEDFHSSEELDLHVGLLDLEPMDQDVEQVHDTWL